MELVVRKGALESTNEEKRIIFHSTTVTIGRECARDQAAVAAKWLVAKWQKKEESAFLTHVISGLFKSPPSTKVPFLCGAVPAAAARLPALHTNTVPMTHSAVA